MFPSSFNLSSLDGTNGFVINGVDADDASGFSVSSAGDVNGDGIDDVIIAVGGLDSSIGESYIVFGNDGEFSSSLNLSSLDGSNGFVINGVSAGDLAGESVSDAGDVNGDGIDDIIVGAFFASPNGNGRAGESYVVFGSDSGFSPSLDLSSLNGTNGFVINGVDAGDNSGRSVSGAGDINGDGIDDIIIGAESANPNGVISAGESYVVFGNDDGFSSSLDLSSLDGINGFVINGVNIGDASGRPVSSAGDVNGDGIDDIVIGAEAAAPDGKDLAGASYVVFGRSSGFSASLELSSLDGSNGFVINGANELDRAGRPVSGAGDVNGDGFDDIIVGASTASPNNNFYSGASYVVFGSDASFSPTLNLFSLDGTNGFVINGADEEDQSGRSVSGAGDVNDDGIYDLIIGAPTAVPNGVISAGESYVVFGRDSGFFPSFNLSSLDGTNGFVFNGVDLSDNSGRSVSGAGDVNGDGIDDVIIGAPYADPDGNAFAGESYVVFGQTTPINPPTPTIEIGLYDAGSDQLIALLDEGTEILASSVEGLDLTIAAIIPKQSSLSSEVESVFLNLNEGQATRIENVEPYALFGDFGTNFFAGRGIPLGSNTIELELYSENRLNGTLLDTVTRSFTIVDDLTGIPQDLDIGLFNAETDELITTLEDGTEIQQNEIQGVDLTIAAFVPEDSPFFGVVESVFLDLNNGQVTRIENVEPYALFGDFGTNLFAGRGIPVGTNTIELELYSENRLNGTLLDTITRSFTILGS